MPGRIRWPAVEDGHGPKKCFGRSTNQQNRREIALERLMDVREFVRSPAGRALSTLFCLAAVGIGGWSIWSNFRTDPTIADFNDPTFIDSENLKSFHHKLKIGEMLPVKSPFTGKNTGYEAELCYWTAEGTPAKDATAVLLKSTLGESGPTFCPTCHRLVVYHNPSPTERPTPPPTEDEYNARHAN